MNDPTKHNHNKTKAVTLKHDRVSAKPHLRSVFSIKLNSSIIVYTSFLKNEKLVQNFYLHLPQNYISILRHTYVHLYIYIYCET